MSVMSETAAGINDILTQGNKMIAAWREALNDLEALLCFIQHACGQKGETTETEEECKEEPAGTAALEQVRPLLAEKARAGYRAEVKALLTKHGAEKLSDISDPKVLGEILKEAEMLGQ